MPQHLPLYVTKWVQTSVLSLSYEHGIAAEEFDPDFGSGLESAGRSWSICFLGRRV